MESVQREHAAGPFQSVEAEQGQGSALLNAHKFSNIGIVFNIKTELKLQLTHSPKHKRLISGSEHSPRVRILPNQRLLQIKANLIRTWGTVPDIFKPKSRIARLQWKCNILLLSTLAHYSRIHECLILVFPKSRLGLLCISKNQCILAVKKILSAVSFARISETWFPLTVHLDSCRKPISDSQEATLVVPASKKPSAQAISRAR